MKIKHAIFDLDGTLTDTNGIWIGAVFKYIDRYCDFTREDLPEIFENEIILGGSNEALAFLKTTMGDTRDSAETNALIMAGVAEGYLESEISAKPGARKFLEKLKSSGTDICVITATPEHLARRAAEKAGLSGCIDFLISADVRKSGKEKPYIFLEAAARMNCALSECTLFEDAIYSVRTGKSLGMTVVAVDDYFCKKSVREEIRGLCDLYISDYSDILLEF